MTAPSSLKDLEEVRAANLPIGPDPTFTDFALMLSAWNAGPAGRAVALEMADFDRNRALRKEATK